MGRCAHGEVCCAQLPSSGLSSACKGHPLPSQTLAPTSWAGRSGLELPFPPCSSSPFRPLLLSSASGQCLRGSLLLSCLPSEIF